MPSSNHDITLVQAREMVDRYRANRDSILKPEFQGQNLLLISETFDRSAFDDLLAEAGCEKIRLYYGMDEKLRIHSIFVAVDADDYDIIPEAGVAATTSAAPPPPPPGTGIKEEGVPCPDFCPPGRAGGLYP